MQKVTNYWTLYILVCFFCLTNQQLAINSYTVLSVGILTSDDKSCTNEYEIQICSVFYMQTAFNIGVIDTQALAAGIT